VRPDLADAYQTIEIVHPDLLTLFGVTPADGAGGKRFSFEQIRAHLDELERQAQLADSVEGAQRSSFQKAVLQLYQNLLLYDRLKYSLMMPDSPDYLAELKRFQEILPAGAAAAQAKATGKPYNEQAYAQAQAFEERFDFLAKHAELLPIPPSPADANQKQLENKWAGRCSTRLAPAPSSQRDGLRRSGGRLAGSTCRRSSTKSWRSTATNWRRASPRSSPSATSRRSSTPPSHSIRRRGSTCSPSSSPSFLAEVA